MEPGSVGPNMRWTEILEDRLPFEYKGTITFFSGGARARLSDEGDHWYIDKVYSELESRGKGDASKAIQKALEFADSIPKPVKLWAIPDQDRDLPKLVRLYQRLGFIQDKNDPECQAMTRPMLLDQ